MRTLLAIITLCLASSAYADALNPADALQQRFDEATKNAEAEAQKQYPMEAPLPSSVPTTAARPVATAKDERSTDQAIDALMRQVESLKSRVIIARTSALAEQKPRTAKVLGARTVYSFRDDEIYQVHAGVDRVTDIELQPGERLTNPPVAGDTVRWKIALVKSTRDNQEATHVIVKPLDTDIETNIIITTNHRTYHLRAIASDWYMPSIAWNYPHDEELESQAKALAAENTEVVSIAPEQLNFAYEISDDDYAWKPLRVFDDGSKTYLQMPAAMRSNEAPALFVIEDDDVLLVNYRVKGDYYIVDRLFDRAQLRVGPKRIIDVQSTTNTPSLLERLFS